MNQMRLKGGLISVFLFLSVLSPKADSKAQDKDANPSAAALFLLMCPGMMSAEITSDCDNDLCSTGPLVDGLPLNFRYNARHILIFRNTEQAEFVSAIWKDTSGTPLHQRDVFMIKDDFVVVVDYIFGEGQHRIERSYDLYGEATSDDQGAQSQSSFPRPSNLRLQAIEPNNVLAKPFGDSTTAKVITLSSVVRLPGPVSTVLASTTGTSPPKIESLETNDPLVVSFKVTFPDGRIDKVALAPQAQSLDVDGEKLNAWAVCSRQASGDSNMIDIHGD